MKVKFIPNLLLIKVEIISNKVNQTILLAEMNILPEILFKILP